MGGVTAGVLNTGGAFLMSSPSPHTYNFSYIYCTNVLGLRNDFQKKCIKPQVTLLPYLQNKQRSI